MRPHLRTITPSILHESVTAGSLRHSELLRGLAPSDIQVLLEAARWTRLVRGSALTLRGSGTTQAWLVLSGYAKEHRALEDGTELLVGLRGPGDVIGITTAMSGGPSSADVTVVADGEALVVPSIHLRRVCLESSRLRSAVMRVLAWRSHEVEDTLVRNQHTDVQQRVARGLLLLLDRFGRPVEDGIEIDVPLTQGELASWMGMSRETAAKALCVLRNDGVASTRRRSITIHDLDVLRAAAGTDERPMAIAI